MITRKKALAMALAGLFLLPLSGCTNDSATPEAGKPGAAKIEVPSRPTRESEPMGALKFGDHEAKIYTFKGSGDTILVGSDRTFSATPEALYYTRDNPGENPRDYVLFRQEYKGEALVGEPQPLDHLGKHNTWFQTSGNTVFYQVNESPLTKLSWYDGKSVQHGEQLGDNSGKSVSKMDFVIARESNDAYYLSSVLDKETKIRHNIVYHSTFADGKLSEGEKLFEQSDHPEFEGTFRVRFADKDRLIVSAEKKKEDKGSPIITFYEIDKQGNILGTYDDGDNTAFSCATLTTNYFIRVDSRKKGQVFRIFDRSNGQLIAEVPVYDGSADAPKLMAKCLWTVTGNDVIAYDEGQKKLYRIDF